MTTRESPRLQDRGPESTARTTKPIVPGYTVRGPRLACEHCGQAPTGASRQQRRYLRRKYGINAVLTIAHLSWCPLTEDGGVPGGVRRG